MTILAAPRRLALPLLATMLLALGLVVAPSAPATAAVPAIVQGISGHVTGPSGTAVAGIEVAFLLDVGDGDFGYYDSASTDVLGNYSASLPAGSWKVVFLDTANGNYVPEWYDDSRDFGHATVVPVTTSHVTSADAQLALAGHIRGTAAGGTGGWVVAWSESSPGAGDWTPWYGADVQPDGSFDVGGLPTGTYRLEFQVDDFAPEFWQDQPDVQSATPIGVTAPNTVSGIDPVLTRDGHVTGHVRSTDGTPIADAFIDGWVLDNGEWVSSDDVWGMTDANGDYDLSAPPGTYRLEFSGHGYVGEFYDDAQSVETATDVTVDGGDHQALDDVVLDAAASISGTVTFPAGADPNTQDGLVTAYDVTTGELAGVTWVDTSAGSGGTYPYTFDTLRAGSYRVEFAGEDGTVTSEAQFFENHPESDGPDSADVVSLTTGQQATAVDATLVTGGTISGTVVNGEGSPMQGCDVIAFDDADGLSKRVGTTGADGTFVVTGLTTAGYHLEVGDFSDNPDAPCPTSEYYTDPNGDLSPSSDGAIAVSAAPGNPQQITADLVYGGAVAPQSQQVTNTAPPTVPAGHPVVGVPVTADPGTWDPADATLTYQWWVSGKPIDGATEASYTPVPDDVGKVLAVVVTGNKDGYDAGTAVSNVTATVVAESQSPTIVNTAPPGITGTARVGLQLSAYPGSWYTRGGDPATTLQWLRDGNPIPGATGQTYLLGADDQGARISLRVTATKDGYPPSQTTSTPTGPVAAGIITLTDVPRLLGVLKVGKVLRAVPPACTPEATGVRYQWLRNGVAIKGLRARKASYTLVAADRGKRISVRIAVLRPGYAPTVSVARRQGKVR